MSGPNEQIKNSLKWGCRDVRRYSEWQQKIKRWIWSVCWRFLALPVISGYTFGNVDGVNRDTPAQTDAAKQNKTESEPFHARWRFLRRRRWRANQTTATKQPMPAARNARPMMVLMGECWGGPGSEMPTPTRMKNDIRRKQTPTEHKQAMANHQRNAAQNRSIFCAFKATLSRGDNDGVTQNCKPKSVRTLESYRYFKRPLTPGPLPVGRGEGERTAGSVTQGGARSSLTLGYNHVIPTGFQFGGAEKVEGAVNIFDFGFLILDLANGKEIYD